MDDPRTQYPQPPFPQGKISPPGSDTKMRPEADHGEKSYRGTGRLAGRKALITGADSGIGRAVAVAFAREGADVAISYYDETGDAAETERLVTEAGQKALLLPGDLGVEGTCAQIARRAVDEFGQITCW